MAKNITLIILLGVVGFFGYFLVKHQESDEGNKAEQSLSQVKQKVPVVIYSSDRCRYCVMAKAFLDKKGVMYDVRDVNIGKNTQEMVARTGGSRSIPQIFINRQHIGGWRELTLLEEHGKLNQMLLGIVVKEG